MLLKPDQQKKFDEMVALRDEERKRRHLER